MVDESVWEFMFRSYGHSIITYAPRDRDKASRKRSLIHVEIFTWNSPYEAV